MSLTTLPRDGLLPSTETVEDELTATLLQLEELQLFQGTKKGKFPEARPPDHEVAFTNYIGEIETHVQQLRDAQLAHSIASAVTSDARAIAELVQVEDQARDDRRVAIGMNEGETHVDAPEPPPPYSATNPVGAKDHLSTFHNLDDDSDVEAGPSQPYLQRQAKAIEHMEQEIPQCVACGDDGRQVELTRLECQDRYCDECLKRFVMRGVLEHDLALLPPRCCGEEVPHAIIARKLGEEDFSKFQVAQIEKDTRDKTYCSNPECGKFVLPQHIVGAEATCSHCQSSTCAMCKGPFHEDDCPADTALQATLELGEELKWTRCFSCRSMQLRLAAIT